MTKKSYFRGLAIVVILLFSGSLIAFECPTFIDVALNIVRPDRFLANLWKRIVPSKRVKNFDFEKFAMHKKDFTAYFEKASLEKPHMIDRPKDFEAQIALIESVTAKSPATKIGLDEILKGKDALLKKNISLLFKRYKFQKGMTEKKMENFMNELYMLVHGNPHSFGFIMQTGLTRTDHELIKSAMRAKILKMGAADVLKSTNFIRTEWYKEAAYFFKTPAMKEFIKTSMNFPLVMAGFPPFYLPKAKLTKWITFSDEAITHAIENGFDSAWKLHILPEVVAKHGEIVVVDKAYSWNRDAFTWVLTIALGVYAYDKWQDLEEMRAKDQRFVDDMIGQRNGEAEALKIETLKVESGIRTPVQEELWNIWLEDYKETHNGKTPDPESEEYKHNHKAAFGD